MTDEIKLVSVQVLSIMERPEITLTELAVNLYKEEFAGYSDTHKLFIELISNSSYSSVLGFIKLIIKTEDIKGTVQYVSMNLTDVITVARYDETDDYRLHLLPKIKEVLPLFMSAIGEVYGISNSTNGTVTDFGVVNNSSVRSSSSNTRTGTSTSSTSVDTSDADMINSHWDYISQVMIHAAGNYEPDFSLDTVEFTYKSAFKHGLRHGRELTTREYK